MTDAGVADVKPDPDLLEWDYGGYEGMARRADPAAGQLFGHPHPGTLSILGTEHGQPVLSGWNVP